MSDLSIYNAMVYALGARMHSPPEGVGRRAFPNPKQKKINDNREKLLTHFEKLGIETASRSYR
jgi:hypothetical protein